MTSDEIEKKMGEIKTEVQACVGAWEPMDYEFMGLVIGTVSGWDGNDEYNILFDFKSNAGFEKLEMSKDITLNFLEGSVTAYRDDGTVIKEISPLEFIGMLHSAAQKQMTPLAKEKS